MKKAIITVLGKDKVGITHGVTHVLAEKNVNILDISQTVLSGMFNMIMIVDISLCDFRELEIALKALGSDLGMQIVIQRSEIFDAMHRI